MTIRTPKQIADDIMDSACLGEPYVRNGVDAALRRDIETAIREAIAYERIAIFAKYYRKTGDDLGYFVNGTPDVDKQPIEARPCESSAPEPD